MARIVLVDGISDPTNGKGSVILAALNSMFTELYAATNVVSKFPAVNSNQTLAIAADTYISSVFIRKVSGTPIVKIGLSAGTDEILEDTTITDFLKNDINILYASSATYYITITGGTVNIRFDKLLNYMA